MIFGIILVLALIFSMLFSFKFIDTIRAYLSSDTALILVFVLLMLSLLPAESWNALMGFLKWATPISKRAMDATGGFADVHAKNQKLPHYYEFTFAPGMTVSEFTLHMLDFGDYNPGNAQFPRGNQHLVTITAYDAANTPVSSQMLQYQSDGKVNPRSSGYGT